MLKRILTAIVLIAIVFGTIFGLRLIHPAFVTALVGIASMVGAYEMSNALKKAEYKSMLILLLIASLATTILSYFFDYMGIVMSITIFGIIACAIFTFDHKYELKDLMSTFFILVYPIGIFNLLVVMNNQDFGMYAILMTIIVPVLTDTMAYFTGVTIGGKKLCPQISPKKTIAGAVGGLIGAIMGTMLIFVLFDTFDVFSSLKFVETVGLNTDKTYLKVIAYIVLGLIAGPICEIGDLAASWIKRKADIKDYGNIFPGHGGVMDRIDSVLFMIPITFIFVELFVR